MDVTPVKEKPAKEEGTDLLALQSRILMMALTTHWPKQNKKQTKKDNSKNLCVPGNVLMYFSGKWQNSVKSNTEAEREKSQKHTRQWTPVWNCKILRKERRKKNQKTQRQTKITLKYLALVQVPGNCTASGHPPVVENVFRCHSKGCCCENLQVVPVWRASCPRRWRRPAQLLPLQWSATPTATWYRTHLRCQTRPITGRSVYLLTQEV